MSKQKHPACLWWLATVFSLFMFAFGGVIASLVLYLHQDLHMSLDHSYVLFGAFASMMWTLPLVGGYLSGKFGHKRAVGVGAVGVFLGLLLLVFGNVTLSAVGLSLYVVGNALFTPALWCLVDHGYAKEDHRREGGFTYFYLTFNLGAVLGIFLGGFVASHFGFAAEFGMDAFAALLAAVFYFYKVNHLEFHPDRKFFHTASFSKGVSTLVLSMVVGVPLGALLLKYTSVNNWLLYVLAVVVFFGLLKMAFSCKDKVTRYRMFAFMALVFMSIAFWALYNLEPSLLSVFIQNNVSREVFGFTLPASSFFAFEGVFVILVGLVLSRVWTSLGANGRDLSLPFKFALSLFLIGLGFLWLVLGTHLFGKDHHLPLVWMVLSYAFYATGELLVGPIGISMVGKLSPHGKEGLLMGVWQLYQGLAAVFGGLLAGLAVVPSHVSLVHSNNTYDHLFLGVGVGVIVLGVVAMCFVPALKKLID